MLTTSLLSPIFFAIAVFSLLVGRLQLFLVRRHLGRPPLAPEPGGKPLAGISILKPLCGVDDDLEANLECFATLGHPRYEILLGVRDTSDPAYPVALAAVARWPHLMRLELQRGEPGLNPKVNQLITLEPAARYELLLISDSNTRAEPGYLEEISRLFEDPTVGCVSHPICGLGEQNLGALMDNLNQCILSGAGPIASKSAAHQDIVVGKSMVLRRETLRALGGFSSVRNVLAEDFILGRRVRELGRRVVLARSLVYNVSHRKLISDIFKRYTRWGLVRFTCLPHVVYFMEVLLNPLVWAVLGVMTAPTPRAFAGLGAVAFSKVLLDVSIFRLLRLDQHQRTSWAVVPAVLLKDVLLFAAWAYAPFARTVNWRGKLLRVRAGSQIVPLSDVLHDPQSEA